YITVSLIDHHLWIYTIMYRLFRQSKHLSTSLISIPALSIPQPNTSFFTPKSSYTKKNAVNTQKPVRKIILLRTDCIFGQFCKLELNKIAARWPAKAVTQFFFS
ncbi:hypothetical protein, partial [Agathobacter rectalis]|uniref:hypothetical protein n=1 Tax=Agathobacter rectalis TaxID=39491 RepID=UPI0027D2691A